MDTLSPEDSKVLGLLMDRGRMSWSGLAKQLGVTPPAAADRVRRLEQRGVIRGYAALLDPEAVGCALTAFVFVTLARPRDRGAFLKLIGRLDEVQECHDVAGDDDYLLKIRCAGTRELDNLISRKLKAFSGVVRTRTTIAMGTIKESVRLPLQ
ncbi:MAG: Lrp/AsnC family transcriptional regulator [Bryobacteraceae bacterium]